MPTQYDTIGTNYDTLNTMPIQQIQHAAMQKHITPLLDLDPAPQVLELACGTGFYTQQLLAWGAPHITASDISPTMLSAARRALPPALQPRVSFQAADGARADMWDEAAWRGREGSFDVVVAAWLLNYAGTADALRRMFANVATALRPGGTCVALTVHAAIIDMFQPGDARDAAERHFGTVYEVQERVDDGYRMVCRAFGEPNIAWEFYFLREDVYAKAALEAGMGQLEWSVVLPEEEHLEKMGKEYWKPYLDRPKAAICISRKPDRE